MAVRAAVAATLLAACSDDPQPGDAITVRDEWARSTPAGATTSAVYFVVQSGVDDAIESVTVDPALAASAEVHMTMDGGDGTTMMHALDRLELPAGEDVVLDPGGNHVMLVALTRPLEAGDTVDVTLDFEDSTDLVLPVPVADEAP